MVRMKHQECRPLPLSILSAHGRALKRATGLLFVGQAGLSILSAHGRALKRDLTGAVWSIEGALSILSAHGRALKRYNKSEVVLY